MDLQLTPRHEAQVREFLSRHRVGLLTILFTDIVGSVELKRHLGDLNAVLNIQRHHALVREILRAFPEGEEVETAGDSFLLVFAKPSDAVKFALTLQARLRVQGAEAGVTIRDRIGIHLGEVLIADDNASAQKSLFGTQVDTAARVMSLAGAGQILVTRAVFDNARQVLKGRDLAGVGELLWMNHGPYLLKGVEGALEICEAGEVGLSPLQPPADSDKASRQVSADGEPVLGWRPAVGQTIPKTQWELAEKLGEGGFGEVWLARQKTLKDARVFKFCFRADRVRSLKREVTLFRLLKERVGEHPHIVRLMDLYFEEPPYYLEMEYVPGRDLATWVKEQGGLENVPMEVRLEIVAQVADALQAAHDCGIIHRDVKPSNILIAGSSLAPSEGERAGVRGSPTSQPSTFHSQLSVKLTDFGIGQIVSDEALGELTKAGFTQTLLGSTGSYSGTRLYMAPELLTAQKATPRSDIYSLGVVLYQLAVGDLGRPLTIDWARHIPDTLLRGELEQCFAGSPDDRFAGASQLAKNLRSLPARRTELLRQQDEQSARWRAADRLETALTMSSGALLTALVGFSVLFSILAKGLDNAGERLQQFTYDWHFSLRHTIVPDGVVVVFLDDESRENLKQLANRPWDRALHAKLLDRLNADGARLIVFDICFDQKGQNPGSDEAFARAIGSRTNVVLSGEEIPIYEDERLMTILNPPLEKLRLAAKSWGDAGLLVDSDQAIRRHPQVKETTPPLAMAAALAYGSPWVEVANKMKATRWVRYYGPPETIPNISLHKALTEESAPKGFFRDKVVFVGARQRTGFSKAGQDAFLTPFTKDKAGLSSAVEIQATIFLNLVRGDWLTRIPKGLEVALLLLSGTLSGASFSLLRPRRAVFLAAVATLMVISFAWLLFQYGSVWFAWSILLVQIGVALGWSLLCALLRYYLVNRLSKEKQRWVSGILVSIASPSHTETGSPSNSGRIF